MAEDDVITNAEAARLYTENLRRLRARDQPVTPDREALNVVAFDAAFPGLPPGISEGEARRRIGAAVDAVLPLLTDALDRARQQGRDDTTIRRPQRQDSLSDQLWDLQRIARREGMYDADDWIAVRLARGQ